MGVKERRHMDDVCLEHTLYEVLSVASLNHATSLPKIRSCINPARIVSVHMYF